MNRIDGPKVAAGDVKAGHRRLEAPVEQRRAVDGSYLVLQLNQEGQASTFVAIASRCYNVVSGKLK